MKVNTDVSFELLDSSDDFAVKCPMCGELSVIHQIISNVYYMRCFACGTAYRVTKKTHVS